MAKGDGIKTKQYSDITGQTKGWNYENNRWNTDQEDLDINNAKKDLADKAEAEKQKKLASDAVKNYKSDEFKFDMDNPQIDAIRRAYGAQDTATREQLASTMAQRGTADSGEMARQIARLGSQEQQSMNNVIGNTYQQQLSQYLADDQTKYQRMLNSYNISNQDYSNAMNNYYQNMALLQEEANRSYQAQLQNMQNSQSTGQGWGSAIGAGLGLATSFIPGMQPFSKELIGIGSSLGGMAGGAIGNAVSK